MIQQTIQKLIKLRTNEWEKIDKKPSWIKYPLSDSSDFIFHVKGKTYVYKIRVSRFKGGNQKDEVWRKLRPHKFKEHDDEQKT